MKKRQKNKVYISHKHTIILMKLSSLTTIPATGISNPFINNLLKCRNKLLHIGDKRNADRYRVSIFYTYFVFYG